MARKRKPAGPAGGKPRGRPPNPTPKIPASFEEIARAVLRPEKPKDGKEAD